MSAAPFVIDAPTLADALRAGIYRVFERTDHLNRINVFPVPDGDTGTNLAMTLAALLAALDRPPADTHCGQLLARAADAALDGARGNSGAILAQFLLGLADGTASHEQLGPGEIASAAGVGATYARAALLEPREGTVLTVIAAFASALASASTRSPAADRAPESTAQATRTAFAELLGVTLPAVHAALESTRNELPEMRAAGVVDAGAQGFVDLLDGMHAYLRDGRLRRIDSPVHEGDPGAQAMAAGAPVTDQRFCTECLIAARDVQSPLDLRRLREQLAPLGNSLVVGGSRLKARVHIHTNAPERIFECAETFGELSGRKADDMLLQQAASHRAKTQRVAIVTDSAADIPDELLEQHDIHVVPIRIAFGGRSYLDKVTLSPEEFFRELATSADHPRTSQPPPGDFRRIYEFLVSHHEAVLSLSVTARVSGTFNAAVTAAQRVDSPRRPVHVIDTASVSLGQGLVVIAAAECARAGGSLEDCERAARRAIAATRTFGLLAQLDYAVRGGRVPKIVRTVANALRLSVVLATYPDGRVGLGGVLPGRRRLTAKFARFVAKRVASVGMRRSSENSGGGVDPQRGTRRLRIYIGHANAPDAAQALGEALRSRVPPPRIESIRVTALGTALGVHGGAGTLVVGFQEL